MTGAWTALVVAAGRADDPLAAAEGAPNKALLDVAGQPMLQRVLTALAAAPSVGRVVVAIEDASLLHGLEPRPETARAAARLADTVAVALEQLGPPLLVATGDSPLLTADMVETFLAGVVASGAGAAMALAPESVVTAAYPASRRTYLRFAEGGYCGCNLYALRTADAARAVALWRDVDANRKRPLRLIRSIDPWSAALYAAGRLTLADAIERLGRKLDLAVAAVPLAEAEAAIDVDSPEDLELVRRILGARTLPSAGGAGGGQDGGQDGGQGRMKE